MARSFHAVVFECLTKFRFTDWIRQRKKSIAPANVKRWDTRPKTQNTRQIHSLCYRNSFYVGVQCLVFCSVGDTKRLGDLLLFLFSLVFVYFYVHYLCCYICLDFGFLLISSIFHVYPNAFRAHQFHCVCVHICDAMQSATDLEMPSISVNWIHIQILSTQTQSVFSQTRQTPIDKMKTHNSRHFLQLEILQVRHRNSVGYLHSIIYTSISTVFQNIRAFQDRSDRNRYCKVLSPMLY